MRRRVWVSLLIAAVAVSLGGVGAQASGGAATASDGHSVSNAAERDAELATRRGKRRPGCRRFCQQAGGFGGSCDETGAQDPNVPCPAVDILEQTVGGTRDGIVAIKATCMRVDEPCVGAIILNSLDGNFDPDSANEYGRADLKIAVGDTKKVKVGLSKKGLRYLKKHGPDESAFATVPLADKRMPVSISDPITLLKP